MKFNASSGQIGISDGGMLLRLWSLDAWAVENSPRRVAAPKTHRSGGDQGFCMYRELSSPDPCRVKAGLTVRHSARFRTVSTSLKAVRPCALFDRDDDEGRIVLELTAGEGRNVLGQPRLERWSAAGAVGDDSLD